MRLIESEDAWQAGFAAKRGVLERMSNEAIELDVQGIQGTDLILEGAARFSILLLQLKPAVIAWEPDVIGTMRVSVSAIASETRGRLQLIMPR